MKSTSIGSDILRVDLLNFGARIGAIEFAGKPMALTYDVFSDFQSDPYYLGASIGPISNRIKNATLQVNDESFDLPKNEGDNCLHSGGIGFDNHIWSLLGCSENSASFQLVYDLTKLGMRGTLTTTAIYRIQDNTLIIEYHNQSDTDTFINTTNHVYLNLSGDSKRNLSDHVFKLYGAHYLETGEDNLPTGRKIEFESPLGYQLHDRSAFDGYVDHHFNVQSKEEKLVKMLDAKCTTSNIKLSVFSNSVGYQFCTAQFLQAPFTPSSGFCIETQYAPNAINHTDFYSPILKAGVTRVQTTVFEFRK